jgi:8-oxo-dGTP diphosphatase
MVTRASATRARWRDGAVRSRTKPARRAQMAATASSEVAVTDIGDVDGPAVDGPEGDGPEVVVGAAIVRDGMLLAARRTEPEHLAGGWELTGGKVEPGESDEDALVREVREELGVGVRLGARVGGDWPLGRYVLRVWLATIVDGGEPAPIEQHDAVQWVALAAAANVDWLAGDREPALAAAAAALAGDDPSRDI